MKLPPFKLEEFWKKYEFSAPYLFCASDAESWSVKQLLELADFESKKLWEDLHLGYTEVPGHPLLRKEIAQLYSKLHADQILTFAGGEEGIYCAMKVLLSKGDHVIVIEPCYQSLETLATVAGADVTRIFLDPNKKWELEWEQLKKAFRPNTRLLILNYPHNPSGTLLTHEVFYGMIELARKSGAYIFSDEMYRFLEIEEKERLPSIADAYEKGIVLFGMTKPFGLAGLRIGWLASQDADFLEKAASYKLYTSISNSAPSEILAIMALRVKEKILERNRKIMLDNMEILDRFFERNSSKVSWVRPQSGTVAVVKLHLPISVEAFTEQLVEETGVLVMPGSVFNFPGNYFRISFGRKNMPDVLRRFEEFLRGKNVI